MLAVFDIAHGDVLLERRAGAAAGNLADGSTGLVDDLGAFTGRSAVDDEADTPSVDASTALALGLELGKDGVSAMETTLLAAVLWDDPRESALDGRGGVIQVVAVQTHAGLEAEAIAGAQAGPAELVRAARLEQQLGQGGRVLSRHGDLEAILARVAAARDEHVRNGLAGGQLERQRAALAKVEIGQVARLGGEDGRDDVDGDRALDGDQATAVQTVPGHGRVAVLAMLGLEGVELAGEVGRVLVAAGGVGDDEEDVPGQLGDDGVVDDAAGVGVQQGGQGGGVVSKSARGRGRDALEESSGAGALEVVLDPVDT